MYKKIVNKYIKDVQSGKVVACEFVKLAIERHLSDLKRDDIYFDEDAANHFLKFSSYCKYTKGQLAKEKRKIELTPQIDVDHLLSEIETKFKDEEVLTIDGVKIIFANNNWVHLRKSNTEPIIRIYSEAKSKEDADKLAFEMIDKIKEVANI